jgi:hypothetical protein
MPSIRRYLSRLGLGLAGGLAGMALTAHPAIAASRCVVQPDDFPALQASRSGVKDQAGVDALPLEKQKMLCTTRALWKRVHGAGDHLPKTWPDDEEGYSPSFLSADELRVFNKLEDDWVEAQVVADQTRHPPKPGAGKPH